MNDFIDNTLQRLAILVRDKRYEALETQSLEIKPVPSTTGEWRELHKPVNAFLNTRGGIVILGIKEVGQGVSKHYALSGYREEAESKVKELSGLFADRNGIIQDLRETFRDIQIRDFPGGRIALIVVEELPADRKFVFYRNEAYRRLLTGDHKLTEAEIDAQEAYREEAQSAREIQPLPDAGLDDLSLDALNDYIQHLNHPVRVETIKADLESARPFLERKGFVKDGQVTLLGMLVCGQYPADRLEFRCHVHGYVDVPDKIAQDKQDLIGNILPLMERSLSYILRNIQIGVSIAGGGTSTPQYPEELLRETVNNALTHRDYSINKQAVIMIKPGEHIVICNPGRFRAYLLIEHTDNNIPLLRIIPEAKARNPKLADVLRVYSKWEGRGRGMSTLVNLCLENCIDMPSYRFRSEEVCLFLRAGRLIDERMEAHFKAFDAYIENKAGSLSDEQKAVLAYLIKSEWENERYHHTILLTPDNNHFQALLSLERCGLITKHGLSKPLYPIYVVDRTLMQRDYQNELQRIYGQGLVSLDTTLRDILDMMYRHQEFSKIQTVTAKMAAFYLWNKSALGAQDIKGFDIYYRKIRYAFNKLEKSGFIVRAEDRRGFRLNNTYLVQHLL